MPRTVTWGAVALLLLAGPAAAEEPAEPAEPAAPHPARAAAEFFSGSSILLEHMGSIGHTNDLSPEASRSFSRTWAFTLAMAPSDVFGLDVSLGMVRELTKTDTTFAQELLVDDLALGAELALPAPGGDDSPFSWSVGLGVALPTSKASRSASLILEINPQLAVGVTAPVLGGLAFGYELTPSPRLHRYTTASTLAPIPCSRATGCELGTTLDMGARNTAFTMAHDFDLSLTFAQDYLTVTTGMQLVYGRLYELSESARYDESIITNPGNDGGSPTTFSSSFVVDFGVAIHESASVSIGIWTPGGLMDDGSGYYNPFANRYTQLYVDLVFTPVDGVLAEVDRRRRATP